MWQSLLRSTQWDCGTGSFTSVCPLALSNNSSPLSSSLPPASTLRAKMLSLASNSGLQSHRSTYTNTRTHSFLLEWNWNNRKKNKEKRFFEPKKDSGCTIGGCFTMRGSLSVRQGHTKGAWAGLPWRTQVASSFSPLSCFRSNEATTATLGSPLVLIRVAPLWSVSIWSSSCSIWVRNILLTSFRSIRSSPHSSSRSPYNSNSALCWSKKMNYCLRRSMGWK